jgi:hypothetical protein
MQISSYRARLPQTSVGVSTLNRRDVWYAKVHGEAILGGPQETGRPGKAGIRNLAKKPAVNY